MKPNVDLTTTVKAMLYAGISKTSAAKAIAGPDWYGRDGFLIKEAATLMDAGYTLDEMATAIYAVNNDPFRGKMYSPATAEYEAIRSVAPEWAERIDAAGAVWDVYRNGTLLVDRAIID